MCLDYVYRTSTRSRFPMQSLPKLICVRNARRCVTCRSS
jgi:hypothetical protein